MSPRNLPGGKLLRKELFGFVGCASRLWHRLCYHQPRVARSPPTTTHTTPPHPPRPPPLPARLLHRAITSLSSCAPRLCSLLTQRERARCNAPSWYRRRGSSLHLWCKRPTTARAHRVDADRCRPRRPLERSKLDRCRVTFSQDKHSSLTLPHGEKLSESVVLSVHLLYNYAAYCLIHCPCAPLSALQCTAYNENAA